MSIRPGQRPPMRPSPKAVYGSQTSSRSKTVESPAIGDKDAADQGRATPSRPMPALAI